MLAVLVARASSADPCDCLNWKQLYAAEKVVCGEGMEFHVFEGALGYDLPGINYIEKNFQFVYNEFCTTFFKKMDNSYCVNMGMYPIGTPGIYSGQWCYVGKACTKLNGGQAVSDKKIAASSGGWFSSGDKQLPREVSWKVCDQKRDQLLREMKPLEVLALAKSMGSSLGYVTKIAYPRLMPPNNTWATVEEAVQKQDYENMHPGLAVAMMANISVVVDVDPSGQGDQKIIRGKEIYDLQNASGWPYSRGKDAGEL